MLSERLHLWLVNPGIVRMGPCHPSVVRLCICISAKTESGADYLHFTNGRCWCRINGQASSGASLCPSSGSSLDWMLEGRGAIHVENAAGHPRSKREKEASCCETKAVSLTWGWPRTKRFSATGSVAIHLYSCFIVIIKLVLFSIVLACLHFS